MVRYIGLDVHKKFIQVCMLDPDGAVLEEKRVPTEHQDLQAFAESLGPEDRVAMEACTFAWSLHDFLHDHAGSITVSNAYKTRAIAEARIKTDKVDARILAELLRADYLPAVWVPDEETQRIRGLVAQRYGLVRRNTAFKNQVHAIFVKRFLSCPHSDMFGRKGRTWMAENRRHLPPHEANELDSLLRLLRAVQDERTAVEKDLAQIAWRTDDARLLMTIPAVDYPGALTVLAAIGDIRRFPNPQKLCAYLGLVPRVRQSGTREWYGSITKTGNAMGRWMLVQSAHQLARLSTPLRPFYERIRKKSGHQVAIVAVARKLATLVWHLLTKQQPYRYANARLIDKKFAQLSISVTGKKRKSGPKPGQPATNTVHLSGGATFSRNLAQVHDEWGLPELDDPPPGEQRHVNALGGEEQWLKIR